jgi:hypothetical protein
MFHALGRTVVMAVLLITGIATIPAANAANVSDLKPLYEGYAHHLTDPGDENEGVTLTFAVEANGQVHGNYGDILLKVKVSAKGVVTFSGKLQGAEVKGTGQLSATGKYLVGTFTFKRSSNDDGKYTFQVASPTG